MANIENTSNSTKKLFLGIEKLINQTKQQVAIYVNSTLNDLNWSIGNYIISEIKYEVYSDYGKNILATLSQELTKSFGKGYSYSALTRMIKVASEYDSEMFATLSQTLTWSHFIELVTIEDKTKRLFYQQMSVLEHWSVRTLRQKQDAMLFERTLIAKKPDKIIKSALELLIVSRAKIL